MELVPKQFAWAGHANWLFSSYTEDVSFWSVLGTLSTLEALFATMRYINWHLHLHLCPEGNINIYLWQTTLCHRAAVCRCVADRIRASVPTCVHVWQHTVVRLWRGLSVTAQSLSKNSVGTLTAVRPVSISQCLSVYDTTTKTTATTIRQDLFSGHDSPGEPAGTTTLRNIFRVTTCMENREMSGILTAVSEMSDILLKVGEVSGKILSGKSGLKLFIVSCMVMVVMVNA